MVLVWWSSAQGPTPNSRLETAYHHADKAIQTIVFARRCVTRHLPSVAPFLLNILRARI
jgi:hypothetical protein